MPVGPSLCRKRGNDSENLVAVAGDDSKSVSEDIGSAGVCTEVLLNLVGVITGGEPDIVATTP